MKPIGKRKGPGMAFVEQCPCCFQKFANLPHRSREKQKAEKEIDEQLKEMVESAEEEEVFNNECQCCVPK